MVRRTVRLFLDSNVILSGLLSDRGAPRIIFDLLSLGLPFLMGSTGQYNLTEIERNLKKRMSSIMPVYKKYLPRLNLTVIPLPKPKELREFFGKITDKDIPVVVSAIKGKADFLITGDRRHFEKLKGVEKHQVKIITPSGFIDSIFPEILKEVEPS